MNKHLTALFLFCITLTASASDSGDHWFEIQSPHIKGVLRNIRCSYPNVLALTVDDSGKKTTLYTNNYYKVVFTTANYEPDGDIKPCTGIEDMKASVKYAEVTDKNVAGQILSIELSK